LALAEERVNSASISSLAKLSNSTLSFNPHKKINFVPKVLVCFSFAF